MFKSTLMKTGALGALVTALLATSLPVQAQDRGGREGRSWGQSERAERPGRLERRDRGQWSGGERRAQVRTQAEAQAQVQAQVQAPALRSYGANRDRSYGANARSGDWGVQQQTREVQARLRSGPAEDRREWRQERREDARETRRDFRQGYRAGRDADGRSDRDAYRDGYRQGRQQDWRDDRRDTRQAYNRGYRAGDRSDDRRWDNRGWRSDNRYDWYRYRASNRNVYRLGRYYAPYNNYRYSRLSIGFRLGSPFYSNRYWINDPWQYRLPPAYGPYRWVRYYDDALLVDIYSGEVVDVIHDFFW